MTTIAIAEDHQSLIDGLKLLFDYDENYEIIGMANDGEKLIDIVDLKRPKVVLTDIRMPKIDGITATKIIKENHPETKVIAFTMFDQQEAIKQMVEAGANGYVLKNSGLEDVKNAIKTVMNGDTYFDSGLDISFLSNNKHSNEKSLLSKTENEILRLIGEGKTSNEIAEIRFCSVSTVETHRKNMMRKLELQGKGELLRYALEKKYDF
ncbi:response regulator transcription factor [Mesonia sp.]|uniref:response regulator n=1 Tax=Mesonia sp. TaxID=1960830 RepID=UPI00175C7729|nr:response regulator transcription factor [Mesonia sp.]HIB38606.1 response regulator transcription factor [Mesonia sp.]HIO26101.1 response regulator transcription factor [Flavobacteriaceae bacterium]